jgi:integrase
MFRLAVKARKLPVGGVADFEMLDESENVREGFVEPGAFQAICSHLPVHLQDAARFGYLTGWRKSAVASLEWSDVDLRDGTILLRASNAKNKRALRLPLEGNLRAILDRRARDRRLDSRLVFHRDGKPLGDYRSAWKTACKRAGLIGTLVHDLRRSAARNAIRAGVPEAVVMAFGGWRTRSMLTRYNVTSERDLADALERTTEYVTELAAEGSKIVPLREHGQNTDNRAASNE